MNSKHRGNTLLLLNLKATWTVQSCLAYFVVTKNILQMTTYLVFLQMSLVVECFRTLGTLERLFSDVTPTNFIQGINRNKWQQFKDTVNTCCHNTDCYTPLFSVLWSGACFFFSNSWCTRKWWPPHKTNIMDTKNVSSVADSGFPTRKRGVHQSQRWDQTPIILTRFWMKSAWKWKQLDRGGEAFLALPLDPPMNFYQFLWAQKKSWPRYWYTYLTWYFRVICDVKDRWQISHLWARIVEWLASCLSNFHSETKSKYNPGFTLFFH